MSDRLSAIKVSPLRFLIFPFLSDNFSCFFLEIIKDLCFSSNAGFREKSFLNHVLPALSL